jgi:hypothetical protein
MAKRIATGETLLYSGTERGGLGGVSMVLSKAALNSLLYWKPVSDRIITACFKTKTRKVSFIQVYAPTEIATADIKEAFFYGELSQTLKQVPKGDIKILAGDLNAKVGSGNGGRESVMGKNGLGEMNTNGELLAELCVNHELVIGGS